jgi:hypothetical protein
MYLGEDVGTQNDLFRVHHLADTECLEADHSGGYARHRPCPASIPHRDVCILTGAIADRRVRAAGSREEWCASSAQISHFFGDGGAQLGAACFVNIQAPVAFDWRAGMV